MSESKAETIAETIRWAIRNQEDYALETSEIVAYVNLDRASCIRVLDAMEQKEEICSKEAGYTRVWWPKG